MSLSHVIVGHSLESLLRCLYSEASLVINSRRRPAVYEKIEEVSKLEVWNQVYWILVFSGKVISSDSRSINLYTDKVEVINKNNTKSIWHFEKLEVASCENITAVEFGMVPHTISYEVRDYFAVKSGMVHGATTIRTKGQLAEEIQFYISDRIDGNKTRKDAATVSILDEDQLHDFDYSDTMARFKLEKVMNRELELKRKARVKHLHRDVVPLKDFKFVDQGSKVQKLKIRNIKAEYAKYKQQYTR